ncbi:MAG: BatD family protein, partial [Myxococcales bacterium]
WLSSPSLEDDRPCPYGQGGCRGRGGWGVRSGLVAAVLLASSSVAAQSRPDLRVSVSDDTVEVGDSIRFSLQATSTEEMPTDPDPGALRGFTVRGRTLSPVTSISIINGVRQDRRGLTATWMIEARQPGTFVLGPPSVALGAERFAGRTVNVRVVLAGHAPPRLWGTPPAPMFPFSPFDPWKGFGPDVDEPQEPVVPTEPSLALEAPRGRTAFLHAMLDKAQAVVGEQVTFTVLIYVDGTTVELTDVHEASASDFVRKSLLEDETNTKPLGFGSVGGRPWSVRLVRKWALFPLKAGELTVGPMALTLAKPRSTHDPRRTSETLKVFVTEPPMAGRPPGYGVGDVGKLEISAEVAPKDIEEGGAVAVTAKLTGTGNLPSVLVPPSRAGVDWLEPQVTSKLRALPDGRYGGERNFAFVVRVNKPGDMDLGELALSYWDPDDRVYGTARAPLGKVHVRAVPGKRAERGPELLEGLPPLRAQRAGVRTSGGQWTDAPWFWFGLGASPMAFAVFAGGRTAVRGVRRRWLERAESPLRELSRRRSAAKSACVKGALGDADASVVRALESASVVFLGVNIRGALGDQIAAKLRAGGCAWEVAEAVQGILRESLDARFSGGALERSAVRDRWERAEKAMTAMSRQAGRVGKGSAE